ncbi:glutamic acid-rich protein-like [Helianthus annuus]|uniref:glutamic acid-rich protein-like n=1 Tax=Helianthus annuus TaxID=4232 RepID=UPI000B9049D5|nr:glutamic acid-rich protein-like [Helianthus annuus]
MIENTPKEKSRAYAVIHDDEGFDWSTILPDEDRPVTAHGRKASKAQHHVLIAEIHEENKKENVGAEIKEKTREEIFSEKTYRERNVVYKRMDDMQDEYESAKVAEEIKTEVVEVEAVKEIKSEEVEVNEEKEEEEVKNENLEAGDAGDEVSIEKKQDDADQKQTKATASNTEVPITEVVNKYKDCENGSRSNLAQQEEEAAAEPWFG